MSNEITLAGPVDGQQVTVTLNELTFDDLMCRLAATTATSARERICGRPPEGFWLARPCSDPGAHWLGTNGHGSVPWMLGEDED